MAATRSGGYPDAPGVALTVNIKSFVDGVEKPRLGAEHDDKSLKDLFELLAFKVIQINDCSKKEFRNSVYSAVVNFARVDGYDGPFFLCIMSHGNENGVMFSDGKTMSTEEILFLFTKDRCKALERRPKIVIIQACRGGQILTVQRGSDGSKARLIDWKTDSPHQGQPVVDRLADTLVFRSSLNRRLSFLSPESGSLFITNICRSILFSIKKNLEDHNAPRCDFEQVVKIVTQLMNKIPIRFDGQTVLNTCELTNVTLEKRLFLSMPFKKGSRQLLESAYQRIEKLHGGEAGQKTNADHVSVCRCINSGCGPNSRKCQCQREGRRCNPGCHRVDNAVCFNTDEGSDLLALPQPAPLDNSTEKCAPPSATPSDSCRCINSGCKPGTKCKCQRLELACTPACRCRQVEDIKCTNGLRDAEGKATPVLAKPLATPARAELQAALSRPVMAANQVARPAGCRCINSGCGPNSKRCRCQREGRLCGPGCHQVENAPCTNYGPSTPLSRRCSCATSCKTDECGCHQAGGACHGDCHPGSSKCQNAEAAVAPAQQARITGSPLAIEPVAAVSRVTKVVSPAEAGDGEPRRRTPALGCCRCINSGCKPGTKCKCQREGRPCTTGCHQVEDAPCANPAACECNTKCMTTRCRCKKAGRPCTAECHPTNVCSNGGDNYSESSSDDSTSDVEIVSSEEYSDATDTL